MTISVIYTQRLEDIPQDADLFLCACGYESRAIHIAEKVGYRAAKKLALGFADQHELRYDENRLWFQTREFEVVDVTDSEYEIKVREVVLGLSRTREARTLIVDISCMNRARLARLIRILQIIDVSSVDVAFVYSLASYSAPTEDVAPTSVAEPVIPEFAGWTNYPERPPGAIIGLGYEQSRAIGIVDHLEINNAAWAFIPRSPIAEYSASLDIANQSLFDMIRIEGRKLYYEVMDPGSLFREMNALADSLKQIYNPIVIPFGPKIFALVSLLVACVHPEVGVWRVSSGALEPAVDRTPSAFTTVLRAKFARQPA